MYTQVKLAPSVLNDISQSIQTINKFSPPLAEQKKLHSESMYAAALGRNVCMECEPGKWEKVELVGCGGRGDCLGRETHRRVLFIQFHALE